MTQTALAAFLLAMGVVFGAFGAHGLRGMLDANSMHIYETAVLYHFFHAFGMLAVPLLVKADLVTESSGKWASRLLAVGIVCFSGSLYVLAITGQTLLGAVAPIGGTAFIAAWMTLVWGAFKSR